MHHSSIVDFVLESTIFAVAGNLRDAIELFFAHL